MPPTLTRAAVRSLVHRALKHGLPREEAEEIVARSWERAAPHFDPSRGSLEALLHRTVQREAIDWWRDRARWQRVQEQLQAENPHVVLPISKSADANQRRLLERLDEQERRIFAAWALQKHLPQGDFDAQRAAETVGLTVPAFNQAKRRLKTRILRTLQELGLESRDLWSVAANEGPRRKRHA
jgi:DNA-directed RNA polymerase specialized sigma24 family protein